jgi:hydroxymethylbilane synthase
LAWAQSGWVAREIERLNPGVKVELVGIDTRGDKILDVSLRNVQGKEFFVAELDEALSSGRVDLCVHSMKDLSLERPEQFTLAAIPRRENPRDVILFGPGVMDKLRAGKRLRIGTSSPRRLENIPAFLKRALPRFGAVSGTAAAAAASGGGRVAEGGEPDVELVEIRGNVNTRLGRVHEAEGTERALDGVVLAFAGLIRLWADEAGRAELSQLLRGVRWMVLPLRESPAAPAQGALAVECRAPTTPQDARVLEIIKRLHHAETAARVARERQLLAEWGGGCHQRFGATAIGTRDLGDVMYVRGAKPDGEFVEETRWDAPAPVGDVAREQVWDGMEHRARGVAGKVPGTAVIDGAAIFVAHARGLPEESRIAEDARVWTSGAPSWYRLAARGVWVEGCAEGFGLELARPILAEKVLGLPEFGPAWTVLTHDQAAEGWTGAAGSARVVATYQVPRALASGDGSGAQLATARHIYWGSGSQYDEYARFVAPGARHCCGPGKTAAHLRARGVEPTVFPSAEEWRKWLKIDRQ